MTTPLRRVVGAVLLAATVVLGAGCTASDNPGPDLAATAPGPTPTPTPTPAPATPPADAAPPAPTVPVRSADLSALTPAAAVPPVSLTVPAVDIAVPIDPVGVQEDGQMEIPPLAERAGWYRYGASPADAQGTTVIAAHVDSVASAGLGPFARLVDVQPGDTVDVLLADGSTRSFVVREVRAVAKDVASWGEVFTRDGPPRLVLVTCGGTFRRDVSSYSDNILVTADPVGG